MGSSATATLAYGYDLGGAEGEWFLEHPLPAAIDPDRDEDEDDEFDLYSLLNDAVVKRSGFTETLPHEYTRDAKGFDNRTEEQRAENKAFYERYHAAVGHPATTDSYGTYEWYGHTLIIGDSKTDASWGCEQVTGLVVAPEWDAALQDALGLLGLHPTQAKPQWLVYPMYG
jgi:hypothetical protein